MPQPSYSNFSNNSKKKKHSKKKKQEKYRRYGQRGNLAEEEYHYYCRVFDQLKEIENNNEKDILIKNVLREIQKNWSLVTNHLVSGILDDILPFATIPSVVNLVNTFSENLSALCIDPFASHNLQTLLILSLRYVQDDAKCKNLDENSENNQIAIDDKSKSIFQAFIIKVSKSVYNNLCEYVCDPYASHVICTVMEVCSGTEVSSSIKQSKRVQYHLSMKEDSKCLIAVSDEMMSTFHLIIVRLMQLPDFVEILGNVCSSVVYQTALLILASVEDVERISKLINHILEHGFGMMKTSEVTEGEDNPDTRVHPLFETSSTCYLMEVMTSVASDKEQESIFELYYQKTMLRLVTHHSANFSVQRLLDSWKSREAFRQVFTSVSECISQALAEGHTGILLALVQACRRLGKCQPQCFMIFECEELDAEEKLAKLVLCMIPLKAFESSTESHHLHPISHHGSLILQEILFFRKPIQIVTSILSMTPNELVDLACDPRGSHVFDAFATSEFVGAPKKEKLLVLLRGKLCTLACSKHGSRSLEALWEAVGVKLRTSACQELFERKDRLLENMFGKIIFHKFRVKHFNEHERKDWEEIQQREFKKKRLLKTMLQQTDDIVKSTEKKGRIS